LPLSPRGFHCVVRDRDWRQRSECNGHEGESWQPFCQQVDDLHDCLVAIAKRDPDAMHALDCGSLPQGVRFTILEEFPSASDAGHVARVRAFILGGGGSVTGYTLITKP
jgi:hypothetical protein